LKYASSQSFSVQRHNPHKNNSQRKASDPDEHFRKVERLFRAIGDGDEHLVRHFLGWDSEDRAESPEIPSSQQLCHPLCHCERCHPLQADISASQSSGLSVNCSNREGITPLHVASLFNSLTLAKVFIAKGGKINAKTKTQQWTPLHLGCQRNSIHVIDLLLTRGADVDAADIRGNSPLHYASLNGFLAAADILLTVGHATCNVVNLKGNTPLHAIAGRGRGSAPGRLEMQEAVGILRLFLEKGADPDIENRQGQTALSMATNPDFRKIIEVAMVNKTARRDKDHSRNSENKEVTKTEFSGEGGMDEGGNSENTEVTKTGFLVGSEIDKGENSDHEKELIDEGVSKTQPEDEDRIVYEIANAIDTLVV
jgi:ankyrin repeat protein